MRIKSSHIMAGVVSFVVGVILLAFIRNAPTSVSNAPDPNALVPPGNITAEEFPCIEVPEVLELTMLPPDKLSTRKMKVSNSGGTVLKIGEIETSCACTTGKISENGGKIPPGGHAFIEITIEPSRIPGFHSEKTLTIFSNDVINPSKEIRVIAELDAEIEFDPPALDFGTLEKGETVEARVLIRQRAETPLEVLYAGTRVDEFSEFKRAFPEASALDFASNGVEGILCSFEKRPQDEWAATDKAEYWMDLKITPYIVPSQKKYTLNIRANYLRLGFNIPIPYEIEADVQAPYNISKREAQCMPRPADGVLSATITVASGAPFSVAELQSEPEALSLSSRETAGNTQTIEAIYTPESFEEAEDGIVRFQIQSGDKTYHDFFVVHPRVTRDKH
jgi:hypothetical protein